MQVLHPQTLGNAFNDSPAGLASWLVERRRSWSDCDGDVERRFSKDELLINVMIYWATETYTTSARFYREAALAHWTPSHPGTPPVGVPTAVTVFKPDVARVPTEEQLRKTYNLTQFRVHERGGHFAPAEEPETFVTNVRDAFRPMR